MKIRPREAGTPPTAAGDARAPRPRRWRRCPPPALATVLVVGGILANAANAQASTASSAAAPLPAPEAAQAAAGNATGTPTADTAAGSLGGRLLQGYIAPAAARLAEATGAAAEALDGYCARPGDAAAREALDQRFGALAEAWGGVEFLRFGPLVEGNRFERFFFFPDPRGVVQRQLGAALAAADPALLEPGALARESVALQGMPALEYALYGSGAEAIGAGGEAGRYRCAYARAVAANLGVVAHEFARAWDGEGELAREFAAPSATGRLYRNAGEVATEALKAISGGFQYLRDIKLTPALGATPEQARGQRAPLWRSARTADLLRGNVAGLRDFLATADFVPVLPEDQRWIPASLHDEAGRVLDSLQAVTLPFDRAVADPEQRRTLEYTQLLLKNLQDITQQNLAPALGVNLGFNAFDGD